MKCHFGEFDESVLKALREAYDKDANSFAESCNETFDFKTCQRSDGTTYGTSGDCAQKGSKEVKGGSKKKSFDDSNLARAMGSEISKVAGRGGGGGNRSYSGGATYKASGSGSKKEKHSLDLRANSNGTYKGTWGDGYKSDYKFNDSGIVTITSHLSSGKDVTPAMWRQKGNTVKIISENGAITTIGSRGNGFRPITSSSSSGGSGRPSGPEKDAMGRWEDSVDRRIDQAGDNFNRNMRRQGVDMNNPDSVDAMDGKQAGHMVREGLMQGIGATAGAIKDSGFIQGFFGFSEEELKSRLKSK